MKRILYSICIGSFALALTAWGQQINDRRPDRAKAHQTSTVRAARPANTGATVAARRYTSTAPYRQRTYVTPRTNSNAAVSQNARMRAHGYNSTAPYRQRTYMTPRTSSNPVVSPDARTRTYRQRNFSSNQDFRTRSNVAVNRDRNFAVNRTRNFDVNRDRKTDEFRARNDLVTNRDRNFSVNRTRNFDVNRYRNTDEFRARNTLAINRDRNSSVNRTRNFDFYRRGNVAINNNFRSAAFRGERYAAFRNYHRQWHDRGWWRRHCDRIVFVNSGWYYWNAGYWYPAWGYDPYAYYTYDGPIYGYNGLTPDQVTVDVQEQLQRDGYYDGPIDGILGPMTQEAIAAFQADNGLAITSAIDEPTLATLGLA
jgi:hypothetical protein